MAKSIEERRKEIAREAAQLAKARGQIWKDLPKERRREFKQQVRQRRVEQRESKQDSDIQ